MMKYYKTLMLVVFFLSIFCLSKINASVRNYSLVGRCIYVDPGHGGRDSGALSDTFMEKDMNLILSNKLASELFSRGAMVFLTRDGDYDLSLSTFGKKRDDLYRRVRLINNSGCDMYISIHMNASPSGRWHGIQVFYSSILDDNKDIALAITDSLKSNMKNVRDYKRENGYYMYSKLRVPGVLIEAGFVSNVNDNYKIRQEEYQDVFVKNVVNGVEKYLNN